jgi:hypothetical protein
VLAVVGLVIMGIFAIGAAAAQSTVGLGTSDSFAVLAGSTVTNTGPSTINGDLGVSPGTAVTGFPPGTVNGTIHAADAVAGNAQSDLTTAYDDAASRTPPVVISGDLGGLTLTPGVYKASSSIGLTGTLTLDAQGDTSAVFVFQVGSTLTTASASHVNLINGAQACNVFWQIGSSATLGTSSVFAGNILALTSISVTNGVTIDGRALARNGAVTLINDTITAAHCATSGGGTGGGTTGGGTTGGGTTGGGSTGGGTTGGGTGGGTSGTGGGSTGTGGGTNGTGGGTNGNGGGSTGGGTAVLTTVHSPTRSGACVNGTFRVIITGRLIRRVVFSLGKRTIATLRRSPFEAMVRPVAGMHTVTARVTFTDGTSATKRHIRVRTCAAARRFVSPPQPPRIPSGFTG